MFQNLDVFKTAYAMAVHAGQKQAVVAQNVANADTPGYIARDVLSFKEMYSANAPAGAVQRATRSGHLHGQMDQTQKVSLERDPSFASPNGNSVSVDAEMLRATDAKRQHDRSLAIYRSALTILRSSLGRQ